MRHQTRELIEVTPNAPEQADTVLMNIEAPGNLSDFLVANLNMPTEQKQPLLEEPSVVKRVNILLAEISRHLEMAKLQ